MRDADAHSSGLMCNPAPGLECGCVLFHRRAAFASTLIRFTSAYSGRRDFERFEIDSSIGRFFTPHRTAPATQVESVCVECSARTRISEVSGLELAAVRGHIAKPCAKGVRARLLDQQLPSVTDKFELYLHRKPTLLKRRIEQRSEVIVDGA